MSKKNRTYIQTSGGSVKIIPLGGLEQIGLNITAFEYGNSIIVVDCGLAFPGEDMPGVDLVVPDVSYLTDNIEKVRGMFITHGHEDHIGALPYVLDTLNVPLYATRLTMAIIEDKLEEHGMNGMVKKNVVKYGDVVQAGDFRVEFIRTNHSIADSAALAIFTGAGTIVHTGDFKVDYTPISGDMIDLQRLAKLGDQGVLALLSDSTNATKPGFTPSEQRVIETFESTFSEYTGSRVLVATFASNVDRVQQIVNTAARVGRKVAIEGLSMVTVVNLAKELGYLSIPDGVLVDIDSIRDYPDEKLVILMTGSQGEAMAALSRVANGQHRKIQITKNDVVVFSSTPIPGNEKAVSRLINELYKQGATIINQMTHVSGHACQEELKLIYALTRPQYAIPVHGEFRHRKENALIAEEMRVPKENIFMLNSGDVLELSKDRGAVTGMVQHGGIMVDGLGVGDVGSIVLRDRQNLSKDGIIVIAITLEQGSGRILAGPEIISRGFVYMRESETLMDEARQIVTDAVARTTDGKYIEWTRIKNEVRDSLGSFFWRQMKRSPVILPVILEV
ncbi:MAG: ribonuclease J [Lachnospiraceae bacterium]|nr:ribonuclease J [Lachnospiraceae bacterium]